MNNENLNTRFFLRVPWKNDFFFVYCDSFYYTACKEIQNLTRQSTIPMPIMLCQVRNRSVGFDFLRSCIEFLHVRPGPGVSIKNVKNEEKLLIISVS